MGLILMGASIAGLIGLAFVQARFPDALENMMMPIEGREPQNTADENALAQAIAGENPAAEAAPEIDGIAVNSMAQRQPGNAAPRVK